MIIHSELCPDKEQEVLTGPHYNNKILDCRLLLWHQVSSRELRLLMILKKKPKTKKHLVDYKFWILRENQKFTKF